MKQKEFTHLSCFRLRWGVHPGGSGISFRLT